MNQMTPIQADTETAFRVYVAPLVGEDGREVDPDIARGVYRDDTGDVIATCGRSFQPVQHQDVLDPILDHFSSKGYDIAFREPDQRGLYDLKGRSGAFVQRQLAKNGAIMRTDIITGDFIEPTGSTRYLDSGDDTMLFKTSIFNSHNGSLAVRVNTSYERLVCLNGMTRASFSAGVYGKHTQGFSLKAMQAQIDNALNGMDQDAETFGAWARRKITREVAETMLQRTIAKLPKDANESGYSERLVSKILDRFAHEDQTVWGLYQAITWWQTHEEVKANSNALTTRINRESRVAKMLRSNEWMRIAEPAEAG